MVSFRGCLASTFSARNGGASIRRITVNRPAAVAFQVAGTGRGGNLPITARASALSCRAAALVAVAEVTSGPFRTARPGSPGGNLATAQRERAWARHADGGGPVWPR